MKYFSTRSDSEPISAAEAIIRGLAPDGGLYVPESFPQISAGERPLAIRCCRCGMSVPK